MASGGTPIGHGYIDILADFTQFWHRIAEVQLAFGRLQSYVRNTTRDIAENITNRIGGSFNILDSNLTNIRNAIRTAFVVPFITSFHGQVTSLTHQILAMTGTAFNPLQTNLQNLGRAAQGVFLSISASAAGAIYGRLAPAITFLDPIVTRLYKDWQKIHRYVVGPVVSGIVSRMPAVVSAITSVTGAVGRFGMATARAFGSATSHVAGFVGWLARIKLPSFGGSGVPPTAPAIAAAKSRVNGFTNFMTAKYAAIGFGFTRGAANVFGGFMAAFGQSPALGGFAVIGSAIAKSVRASSDLNESVNKTKIIFGSSASFVLEKSDEMANKFGIVKKDWMDSTSQIGNLLYQMGGLSEEQSAKLANNLSAAAADAASTFNVSFEEASNKIKSAIRGQSKPISEFGVNVQLAAVKQEAYRLGLAKTGETLSEHAKVVARASLVVKGLAVAQGDLARTHKDWANAARETEGRVTNLFASVGMSFKPIAEAMINGVNGIIASIQAWADRNKPMIDGIMQSVTTFGYRFVEVVTRIGTAIGELFGASENLGPLFDLSFIGRLADAFIDFLDAIAGMWEAAKGIPYLAEGLTLIATILAVSLFPALGPIILGFIAIKNYGAAAFEYLGVIIRNYWNIMLYVGIELKGWYNNFVELAQWAGDAVGTIFVWVTNNFTRLFTDAFNLVGSALGNLKESFRNFGIGIGQWIASGFTDTSGLEFKGLLNGFKATVDEFPKIAGPALSNVKDELAAVVEDIGKDEIQHNKEKTEKAKEAAAKAAREAERAGIPKRPGIEDEFDSHKEETSRTESLESYVKRLQEGVFGKNDHAKKTAENTKKTNELINKLINNGKNPVPGVAIGIGAGTIF